MHCLGPAVWLIAVVATDRGPPPALATSWPPLMGCTAHFLTTCTGDSMAKFNAYYSSRSCWPPNCSTLSRKYPPKLFSGKFLWRIWRMGKGQWWQNPPWQSPSWFGHWPPAPGTWQGWDRICTKSVTHWVIRKLGRVCMECHNTPLYF